MGLYIGSIAAPPRVMSEDEQQALLNVTGEHRRGLRDHVIIAMALGTALREHEIVALDVGDVVNGKGKIRRRVTLKVFKRASEEPPLQEVILSETLRVKLKRYLAWKSQRAESVKPSAPLFMSRKGNRLSTRQLRHLLKKWQERVGFERPYNFHTLRHCAITNIYRRTKDIRLAQRFARHKSLLSTQRYAHASFEELLRAVQDLPC